MKFLKTLVVAGMTGAAVLSGAIVEQQAHAENEKVTYLLPAPAFLPAFSPWMLALARGYYAEEGLDVEFQVAKGGVDVAKQVGAGNAVVGGAIGDTPIIVRANGVPVKAVAVLGGRSLMQLVVNTERGIEEPKDLMGKTVTTLAYQDTTYYALLGMLAAQGLSKDDVNAQAVGPVNVWKLFVAGEADAMASVPDWTYYAQQTGMTGIKVIPSDEYFRSMAQAIIVADETIENNPELVRKIVTATLKGMKDIMADPEGAAVDYVKAVPQHAGKEADMAAIFRMFSEYVYAGQDVVGEMDAERLAGLQKFYLEQGIVRSETPLEELYTNEFVK